MREAEALLAEELEGIRLGFRLRLVTVPAPWHWSRWPSWRQSLFHLPFAFLLCLSGYAHWRHRRSPAGHA